MSAFTETERLTKNMHELDFIFIFCFGGRLQQIRQVYTAEF